VTVVPEIEMPAHVMSAIAAYPELSCSGEPIGVPSGGVWPITEIYCAGKENTFEFLENVLIEVMELFPSTYIHVGGDEATKTNWESCPNCQRRIVEEGLHDVEELQSYFIKRMEKFINSNGRKLIGWDEILEGGLAPDATVMSWRGFEGGLEASAQGHDVVMSPTSHCYIDYYQGPQNEEPLAIGGYLPLSKVYTFDPVVPGMTPEQQSHVLGGQVNLWSEYVATNEHSEYMIYPRLAALAESVWSPAELKDWPDFSRRITDMFERYEALGINYSRSAYLIMADTEITLPEKEVMMHLGNEFPNADIRYTLDPEQSDYPNRYEEPISIRETVTVKASVFEDDKPVGRPFEQTIKFHKAVAKDVDYLTETNNRYKGTGEFNLVNTLRGSKNFRDGQWQAWLGSDMEVVINLDEPTEIRQVSVGSMENQGPGIYYPVAIEVLVSDDGKTFTPAAQMERPYAPNAGSELKDFALEFDPVQASHVKVIARNLMQSPRGGGVFIFIDEIVID
jgi:hexosaminidase